MVFFFFGGVLNFGKYLCENKVVKKWNKFEKKKGWCLFYFFKVIGGGGGGG